MGSNVCFIVALIRCTADTRSRTACGLENPGAFLKLSTDLLDLMSILSSLFWGWLAERIGRRWAIMIPAALGVPTAFFYLLTQV